MDDLHLRREALQPAAETVDQGQEQIYIDGTVSSLVRPVPGYIGTSASQECHLPAQPWGGAIELGPQSLQTTATTNFGWPQALVSNTTTASASGFPPRGFTPSNSRDTPFSQLIGNITSTDSISSGLPRGFQSNEFSAASRTLESQPPSKRKRYATQSQPPPTKTTGSAAAHTRSSTTRRKSIAAPSSRAETEEAADDEEQERLRIYRERNRISAAKTRQRKKFSAKELEERAQEVLSQNEQLRQEERTLRDHLSTLRITALDHDPTSNPLCHCDDIYLYNQRKAAEMAQNLR